MEDLYDVRGNVLPDCRILTGADVSRLVETTPWLSEGARGGITTGGTVLVLRLREKQFPMFDIF